MEPTLDTISNLAKRRAFIYPGSDIYGGLAGTYDYGPNGVLLKENIKTLWRQSMTFYHDNIVELDSAIFMNPKVWEASGHVGGFSDPLVECKECNNRHRADHLLEEIGIEADEKMTEEEINKLWNENITKLKCPSCKKTNFTAIKNFNMLVTSNLGDFSGKDEDPVYLRGETAQGIYVNFKNVIDSTTLKIPFGVAQIGKAFRNEIKPRQFVFRMREFEQMEMQYFVHENDAKDSYEAWKEERLNYYINTLGISKDKLRLKQHENLVFYAKDAWDIEYKFDFGWKEIEGLHWRGNYDLTQHENHSKTKLHYTDPYTGEKYIPHVIEASSGLDRVFFMLLHNAYQTDNLGEGERVFLNIPPSLAPIKLAISPLLKNKPELVEIAKDLYQKLKPIFGHVAYDDHGNIGKRYRRQDEIGTPFCVVVDFDTKVDNTVTVRDRNTGSQERIGMGNLETFLKDRI